MRIIQPLTIQKIKSSIKNNQNFPLRDGAVSGLQLDRLKGGFRWRLRYSFGKKRSYYTLGDYPTISLAKAREMALDIKRLLIEGIDPQEHKKNQKESLISKQTQKRFFELAQEFFEIKSQNISKEKFKKSWLGSYKNYIHPKIGQKRVDEISKKEIINLIKDVPKIRLKNDTRASNKTYKAKEVLAVLKAIFEYGVDNEIVEINPAYSIKIASILPKEIPLKMRASTNIDELREIFAKFKSLNQKELKYKLMFQALTALRNVGLYRLKWEYIDFKKGIITYPPLTYKANQDRFRIPLTPTLIEILEFFKKINQSEFVFRNPKTKEASFSSLMSKQYKRLNITNHSPHGWRASFKTLAVEGASEHNFSFEVIEAQLNHKIGDKVTQAYLRSDFLEQRRELLLWWEGKLN